MRLIFCVMGRKMLIYCIYLLIIIGSCTSNKYSKKYNVENLATQEKPFRMLKLNLIWEKALKKISTEKLKHLYTDLKYQDKEELALKKLKADGLDKEGLKEALIRGSFNAILEKYNLKEDFKHLQEENNFSQFESNAAHDAYYKNVFRDKKLNKLWLKAEKQGFTDEELNALKEEFQHHQSKIDQYYEIMDQVNKGFWSKDDRSNNIEYLLNAEEGEKLWKSDNPHQILKEKHQELKAGYDYLTQKLIPSMKNMEFEEPQVNSLWELAKNASFTPQELESLRRELHHFEHRIRKLKTLTSLEMEKDDSNFVDEASIKRQKKIKEYNYKVEKIARELTDRIIQRHTEL